MPLTRRLEQRWYRAELPPPWPLRPLAALYGWVADRQRQRAAPHTVSVPVLVVGNISVGGTGKTPVVQALVAALQARGWRPGVVSRGYGGRGGRDPMAVTRASDPADCGDEPLLIHLRTGVPVQVAADRVAAAHALIADGAVDVIVADDGLQHYRLARDVEVCVIDGVRGLGNGARLPAGPLREEPARLREVDQVLVNGGSWTPAEGIAWHRFSLRPGQPYRLDGGSAPASLSEWRGRAVHAVAGIGHPQRFFATLADLGLVVHPHAFPDHHAYEAADLPPADPQCPVMMTEKDAVKCRHFDHDQLYALPVTAELPDTLIDTLNALLKERSHAR